MSGLRAQEALQRVIDSCCKFQITLHMHMKRGMHHDFLFSQYLADVSNATVHVTYDTCDTYTCMSAKLDNDDVSHVQAFKRLNFL